MIMIFLILKDVIIKGYTFLNDNLFIVIVSMRVNVEEVPKDNLLIKLNDCVFPKIMVLTNYSLMVYKQEPFVSNYCT